MQSHDNCKINKINTESPRVIARFDYANNKTKRLTVNKME